MSDFQAFFHNPSAFSDADLRKLRMKIRGQRLTPVVGAASGFGAMWYIDTALLKRGTSNMRLTAAALAGFVIGGRFSYTLFSRTNPLKYSSDAQDQMDSVILNAFTEKYIYKSLNAAGYGNNALSLASHTTEHMHQYNKPY